MSTTSYRRTFILIFAAVIVVAVYLALREKPSAPTYVPPAAPAVTLSDQVDAQLTTCSSEAAGGTVRNGSSETVDIFIRVVFLSSSGTQVSDSIDNVNGLAPGRTAQWTAPVIGSGSFARCEARVSDVFPSR